MMSQLPTSTLVALLMLFVGLCGGFVIGVLGSKWLDRE